MAKVWAHRGASKYAPENTMAAFALAAEQGAFGIELDVQQSRDGELVVCHDDTIDRTSDGTGRVGALSYAELCAHNFAAGRQDGAFYRIPRLREVLDFAREAGLRVNVELKQDSRAHADGLEGKVVAAVRAAGMEKAVRYSSFDHYALRRLRFFAPFAETAILYEAGLYEPWAYAATLRAQALHPHYATLFEPHIVDLIHKAGLEVCPWTVDDEKTVAALGRMGVDGVITNDPARTRRVLAAADCLY